MATSQTRARPRKAATPKAVKAPATRKTAAVAKKAVIAKKTPAVKKTVAARKSVAKTPALVKKKVVKKAAPLAKKAAPAKKATPRKAASNAAVAKLAPKPKARPKAHDPFERLHTLVIEALDGLKANDVREIDVRGKSSVADLLVVASGTSTRHVKSLAEEVVKKAKQAGLPPIGVEGQREAEWVLVDLGDVIVHVMLPRTREFYGLERLWSIGSGGELPSVG